MEGWIKLYRAITNNWIWENDKYFRWWLTILIYVNYSDIGVSVGNKKVICKAGESFRSIENWSLLFGCAKKTTIKFFRMLEKDEKITCEIIGNGNRRKHRLSVINWAKYQGMETENYTENYTGVYTLNKNIKNNKNNIKENNIKEKSKIFQRPTIEEIQNYILEKSYSKVDAEKFFNHYESNGWMVGKNHMKDWKAAIRYWQSTAKDNNNMILIDNSKDKFKNNESW